MQEHETQEYTLLHEKIINASTANEVEILRAEAWHKGFGGIVREGRQILISSFGYTIDGDGKLLKPRTA